MEHQAHARTHARQGQERSIWWCSVWRERNVVYKMTCERCKKKEMALYHIHWGRTEQRPLYKRVTRNTFVMRSTPVRMGRTPFAVPSGWRGEPLYRNHL
ncbi:hypothetical protein ACOME3_000314 [Neoechinorhynchus agilis]